VRFSKRHAGWRAEQRASRLDWAALQPDANHPPSLQAAVDGCARSVRPCGAYAGLREEFAAIASQQRAARAQGRAGFEPVLDVFGTAGIQGFVSK
jgi:hypothetical protein